MGDGLGVVPTEIAARLRRDVRVRVGLPITVGVARTKFLAKVASGVAKPDGLLEVPPDRELEFLHALPIERLWGVGAVAARPVASGRGRDVGQVAALPRGNARVHARRWPRDGSVHALALNRDPRRVQPRRRRRSIEEQRALGRSRRSAGDLDAVLLGLVDRRHSPHAGGRARREEQSSSGCASTTSLAGDALGHAETCDEPRRIRSWRLSRGLLSTAMPMIERRGITLVGIAVCNLENDLQATHAPLREQPWWRSGRRDRRDPRPLRSDCAEPSRPPRP